MTYVIHMASPFPHNNPRREDDVVKPAVEGTLSVLRACVKAGTVKRVVLTSSCAAVDCKWARVAAAVAGVVVDVAVAVLLS